MKTRVLVVDDSSFFRRRVSEILNADPSLEVIEAAKNGQEAVEMAARLKPDVITMDIEMPVMDGISAVRAIMAANPTPILMFSSLTHQGAQATLDALEAGALDFLPKKFEDIARDREEAVSLLQQRVRALARRRMFMRPRASSTLSSSVTSTSAPSVAISRPSASLSRPLGSAPAPSGATASPTLARPDANIRIKASGKRYRIVAIGTSTGGPVALQNILTKLPADFPLPIVLVQHMPAAFTGAFAERLNSLCKIAVKHAEDGDVLRPGCAYLAPGGFQMLVDNRAGTAKLRVLDSNEKVNYKPCVDVTFASLAKSFGGDVLTMVLTGMGADGRDGSRLLKQAGSTIWAQDEESCVVYGMPQAVANAGLCSMQLPLGRFAEAIVTEVTGR